jgi:hypothetical protein
MNIVLPSTGCALEIVQRRDAKRVAQLGERLAQAVQRHVCARHRGVDQLVRSHGAEAGA